MTTATVVERSSDGIEFMSIGEAHAGEYSGSVWNNQFIDHQDGAGMNYYRLKKTDEKGTTVYSPVRLVRFDSVALTAAVTPNPADEKLFIRIDEVVTGGHCILMDALGIQRIRLEFDAGEQDIQMGIRHLEEGAYTLHITAGETTYTERIAIVH